MDSQTCVGCNFMKTSLPGKNLQRQSVCTRFPPSISMFAIQTPQGQALTNTTHYPIVTPETFACGEFQKKEAANA